MKARLHKFTPKHPRSRWMLIALGLFVLRSASGDLIGFYSFDDAGNTLADDSGTGNTLTSAGVDPTHAANGGVEGGAFEFDGFQRLIAPIDIGPTVTPELTVGAWVKTATLDAALRKVLGSDNGGWDRTLGLDNRNGDFRYTAFVGTGPLPGTPGPVSIDDWTFIAATFDEPNKSVAVYVDLDSSTTDDVPVVVRSPSNFNAGAETVSIGSVGPDAETEGWQGLIDNVFFFDEVLDAGQIRTIRDGKKGAVTGDLAASDPSIVLGEIENFGLLPNKPGPQTRTIMVSNFGAAEDLTLSDVSFSGPQAAAFMVTSPAIIVAGGTGDIVVTFDPGSDAGQFDAVLEISSDDFGSPVVSVDFQAKVAAGLLSESLLGFYTFDDADNPLVDMSGRGNHLTLPGGDADPVYGAGSGVQGGSYTFDGMDRLVGSINLNPDAVPELTVGAWVKTSSIDPGERKVFGTDNGGWDRTIGLDARDGEFRYTSFIGNGRPVVGTPGPESTDAWAFIAVAFDQTNEEVTVYVDTNVATLDDEMAMVSEPTGFTAGFETFSVGSLRPDNPNEGWQGEIDNLFIAPSLLTKEQLDVIRAGGRDAIENFGFGPPREALIAFYPFDDATNPLEDAAGSDKTLDPASPPTYDETGGVEGGAYDFDGNQRFVANIDINPTTIPELTLGAWVKPSNLNSALKKVIGSDDGGWDRTIGLDNREGDFRYTSFVGNGRPVIGTPGPVNTEDWTFLAVVYDEPNTEVTVYVDLDVTTTDDPLIAVSEPTGFGSGVAQISIGSLRPDNNTEGWVGLLDNVFFYDTKLTLAQLSYMRDGGSAAILGSTGDDPDLSFSRDTLFGALTDREPTTRTLELRNSGRSETLNITGVTLVGPDSAYFSISEPPGSLIPGATGDVVIAFDPRNQTGDFVAQLWIESDDESQAIATLNLSATTPASADVDPLLVGPLISPFGQLTSGMHERSVSIQNTGATSKLTIASISIEGQDADHYQVGAPPEPIPPGESGEVTVIFDSAGDFGQFQGTLLVTSDSGDNRLANISVDSAVPITNPEDALIGFYSFDDPSDPLKDDSENGNTLTQPEGAEPTFGDATGFDGSGGFEFDGSQRLVAPIDINTSAIPELTFGAWVKPSNLDSALKKVMGHDNGGWDRTIGLDNRSGEFRYSAFLGNGVLPDSPSPVNSDDWTFLAAVYNDNSNEVTLYVDLDASSTEDEPIAVSGATAFNTGFDTVSIGSLRPDVINEGWVGLIDRAFFFDAALGAENIRDLRDGGILPGAEDPNIRASGGFGDLGNNVSPVTRTVTIRNSGRENDLIISGTNLSGPDAAHFSLVGELTDSIAKGETATVDVRLDPMGRQGGFVAFLTIDSNDPGDPTFAIDLSAAVTNGNGLLAHYKLDENEGSQLLDASGLGRHGNYATTGSGVFALGAEALATGTAATFDDIGDDTQAGFGLIPASLAPGPLSAFSVSMWINQDADAAGVSTLFAKGTGSGDPFAVASLNGSLVWFSGGQQGFSIDNAITSGQTHHVVVTHDVVDGESVGVFYVDGAEVGSSGDVPPFDDSKPTVFQIGALNGAFGFKGVVDDVQVYGNALSPIEVSGLFDAPGSAVPGEEIQVPTGDVFMISEITKNGEVGLSWTGKVGHQYVIEYSETLNSDWIELETVDGVDGEMAFSDTNATRLGRLLGFYRLRQWDPGAE